MAGTTITYQPHGTKGFTCTLTTSRGSTWSVTGQAADPVPTKELSGLPRSNRWLLDALWSYGKLECEHRRSRHEGTRKSLRKQADELARETEAMGNLLDRKRRKKVVTGWCSACFRKTQHSATTTKSLLETFICNDCGSPTVRCSEPRCRHMSAATPKRPGIPRFCAEHRHEIPAFDRIEAELSSLDEVDAWLKFKSPNRGRQSKVLALGLGSAAVLLPLSLAAAPFVGGAIGSSFLGGGLTGAAATSHGLAMLGGGSLAGGGLGMAGGTMVVGALGSALGGAMGAAVTTAYVGEDKSFKIEKLRSGEGPAIIVVNGFLTEGTESWGPWQSMVDQRFEGHPVYRVHWGSKEIKALTSLLGVASARQVGLAALRQMALRASKAATTAPVAAALAVGDVAKNPWSVARRRAMTTGVALAGLLARIPDREFILVGHSLGGLVALTAAETLGTKPGSQRLAEVHLLGAAAGAEQVDWRVVARSLSGNLYNYYSTNDAVLNNIFRVARMGERAIGTTPIKSPQKSVRDRNVSRTVPSHGDYFFGVNLAEPSS